MHYSNSSAIALQASSLFLFLMLEKKNIRKRIFSGLLSGIAFDSFMHLVYFLITAMPFLKFKTEFAAGAALSIFLDIDHALEARSLDPEKLLSLGRRPYTHSILFSLVVSLSVIIVSSNPALSYIVFVSMLSHVMRDFSSGVTHVFYPFKQPSSYAFEFYVLFSVALAFLNRTILSLF